MATFHRVFKGLKISEGLFSSLKLFLCWTNYPCIPVINFTWLWCTILLIFCWIHFLVLYWGFFHLCSSRKRKQNKTLFVFWSNWPIPWHFCSKCALCVVNDMNRLSVFEVIGMVTQMHFIWKLKTSFIGYLLCSWGIWVSQTDRYGLSFVDLLWGKDCTFPGRILPLPPERALDVLCHNYFFILRVFEPNHCSRKTWGKSIILAFYIT